MRALSLFCFTVCYVPQISARKRPKLTYAYYFENWYFIGYGSLFYFAHDVEVTHDSCGREKRLYWHNLNHCLVRICLLTDRVGRLVRIVSLDAKFSKRIHRLANSPIHYFGRATASVFRSIAPVLRPN